VSRRGKGRGREGRRRSLQSRKEEEVIAKMIFTLINV